MEVHRIGVISDTHGLLRPEVEERLKGCEAVFHGGDMGEPGILERLKAICPVYAVRGNVDGGWAEGIPLELEGKLHSFHFYMIHNRKQMRKSPDNYDIVIYGHSHKYEENRTGKTLWLNPGSCGPRRFRLPVTMTILTLFPGRHQVETERIDCLSDCPPIGEKGMPELSRQDMYKLVRSIMKAVDAGKPVETIAARNQVDRELVEQICRMYVTHPGVDVDGIMDRMERRNL